MSKNTDSHISILMPEGTACYAYIPFEVDSFADGNIIKINYVDFVRLAVIVGINRKKREVLTDLPHSPARTIPNNIHSGNSENNAFYPSMNKKIGG